MWSLHHWYIHLTRNTSAKLPTKGGMCKLVPSIWWTDTQTPRRTCCIWCLMGCLCQFSPTRNVPCDGSAPPSHLNRGKWGLDWMWVTRTCCRNPKKTQLTKTGGYCHFQPGRKAIHGKGRAVQSSDDMM